MLQTEALDILKMGHNVYLTGAAGSGKTFVLNEFIKYLRSNNIVVGVTASTGIAATHMNGMTVHSWAGMGITEITQSDIERLLEKSPLRKRMNETKVLIIDEVSMLDGQTLDAVDAITRAFKNPAKPFGGLQVVLSGDLFQLPPVTKTGEPNFVFKSQAWKTMNLKCCYLEEQHRQDDSNLLNVLQAIRTNSVDDSHFEDLQARIDASPSSNTVITKLYTHNRDVDGVNQLELDKLDTETKVFNMTSKGNKKAVESLIKRCLAPESLVIKTGAEVMFVANSQTKNFVNGTLGRIVDFDEEGLPIVKTKNRLIYVQPHTWKTEDGPKVVAEISQLPLRLAWAITVHKSQGMSLDAAEIDLTNSFEPGMGYVALSRVRSIEGLFIKGINNMAMVVNPKIIELDAKLKAQSAAAQQSLSGIKQDEINRHQQSVRTALRPDEEKLIEGFDEVLFDKLKSWRSDLATKQSAPAYTVLPDKSLKLIAAIKPKDQQQLAQIHGIGPAKLEKYADQILPIVNTA
jgi:hypothetical protein